MRETAVAFVTARALIDSEVDFILGTVGPLFHPWRALVLCSLSS